MQRLVIEIAHVSFGSHHVGEGTICKLSRTSEESSELGVFWKIAAGPPIRICKRYGASIMEE